MWSFDSICKVQLQSPTSEVKVRDVCCRRDFCGAPSPLQGLIIKLLLVLSDSTPSVNVLFISYMNSIHVAQLEFFYNHSSHFLRRLTMSYCPTCFVVSKLPLQGALPFCLLHPHS